MNENFDEIDINCEYSDEDLNRIVLLPKWSGFAYLCMAERAIGNGKIDEAQCYFEDAKNALDFNEYDKDIVDTLHDKFLNVWGALQMNGVEAGSLPSLEEIYPDNYGIKEDVLPPGTQVVSVDNAVEINNELIIEGFDIPIGKNRLVFEEGINGIGVFSDDKPIEGYGMVTISPVEGPLSEGVYEIESVQLPRSLRYIGLSAFEDFRSLTDIKFQEGLEIICGNAFSGCESLESVHLPQSLRKILTFQSQDYHGILIPYPSFGQYPNLKEVFLYDSLEFLDICAFGENNKLERVEFLRSKNPVATRISLHVFDCSLMEEIILPEICILEPGALYCMKDNPNLKIKFNGPNPNYIIKDDLILTKDHKTLVSILGNYANKPLILPDGIENAELLELLGFAGTYKVFIPSSLKNGIECIENISELDRWYNIEIIMSFGEVEMYGTLIE